MEGAVHIGLTRSIGLSNFNQQQIENILQKCTIPPAILQVILSYIFLFLVSVFNVYV